MGMMWLCGHNAAPGPQRPLVTGLDLCCSRAGGSPSGAGQGNLQGGHKSPGKIPEEYKNLKNRNGRHEQGNPSSTQRSLVSPQQHPAPARAGWSGGVGLDWSVHMPGSLFLGLGHGSWRALWGLPAYFVHLPVGSPFWRHPQQRQKAAWPLTSARGHPCLSHLQEPGSMDQESPAQGTWWGAPSLWGPACLFHCGAHTSKPMAVSDAPSALQGPVSTAGTQRWCDPPPPTTLSPPCPQGPVNCCAQVPRSSAGTGGLSGDPFCSPDSRW